MIFIAIALALAIATILLLIFRQIWSAVLTTAIGAVLATMLAEAGKTSASGARSWIGGRVKGRNERHARQSRALRGTVLGGLRDIDETLDLHVIGVGGRGGWLRGGGEQFQGVDGGQVVEGDQRRPGRTPAGRGAASVGGGCVPRSASCAPGTGP